MYIGLPDFSEKFKTFMDFDKIIKFQELWYRLVGIYIIKEKNNLLNAKLNELKAKANNYIIKIKLLSQNWLAFIC